GAAAAGLDGLDGLDAAPARHRLGVVVAELRRDVGGKDLGVGPAEELAARAPERLLRGVVHEHVAALEVLDPGEPGQPLHELSEALLALAQRRDRLLRVAPRAGLV